VETKKNKWFKAMLPSTLIALVCGMKTGTENASSPEHGTVGVAFFGLLSWNIIRLPKT